MNEKHEQTWKFALLKTKGNGAQGQLDKAAKRNVFFMQHDREIGLWGAVFCSGGWEIALRRNV